MYVLLYLYSFGMVKMKVGGKIVLPQVRLELTASAYHSTVYKYGALTDCATGARHDLLFLLSAENLTHSVTM